MIIFKCWMYVCEWVSKWMCILNRVNTNLSTTYSGPRTKITKDIQHIQESCEDQWWFFPIFFYVCLSNDFGWKMRKSLSQMWMVILHTNVTQVMITKKQVNRLISWGWFSVVRTIRCPEYVIERCSLDVMFTCIQMSWHAYWFQ